MCVKKFFHVVLRGNNYQNLFLDQLDYINVLNRLALAAYHTDTELLAISFLSNHFHLVVYTQSTARFMHYFRKSLTNWFNKKYNSIGNVGTREYFKSEIIIDESLPDKYWILKDKICYTLRNPIWHGVTSDFFNYPWSSISVYYHQSNLEKLIDQRDIGRFLPHLQVLPPKYRMSQSGLILMDDYINKNFVEKIFGSYDHFIKELSAPSPTELKRKDEKITKGINNNGFAIYQDIHISEILIQKLNADKKDLTQLTITEKVEMYHHLKTMFPKASIRQIARILLIPESTLRTYLS